MKKKLQMKVASIDEIGELEKLSTEKLIIWIIGRAKELEIKLSAEEIVLECWQINSNKHSLRKYPEYPDSHTVMKRIGEMKGKKGLLRGSEMGGYYLTEISSSIFADLSQLVRFRRVSKTKGNKSADRTISSIDEAPYKRLKKTPAYIKVQENRINEIVETDYLYFYGINWHTKKSQVINRIKNTDLIVDTFANRDNLLLEAHNILNTKFRYVKEKLLGEKTND